MSSDSCSQVPRPPRSDTASIPPPAPVKREKVPDAISMCEAIANLRSFFYNNIDNINALKNDIYNYKTYNIPCINNNIQRDIVDKGNAISGHNNNLRAILNSYNVNAEIKKLDDNIAALKYYYDTTLPEEHKTLDVDPLNEQIAEQKSNINNENNNINFNNNENRNFDRDFPIIDNIDNEMKKYNSILKKEVDNYFTLDTELKSRMYDNLLINNKIIEIKTNSIKGADVSNDRAAIYLNEKSSKYNYINILLLCLYYICVLAFLYELFVVNIINVNIYIKVFIVFLLGFYPFYVDWIESYFFYISKMLYSFLVIKVYKDPKSEYDVPAK